MTPLQAYKLFLLKVNKNDTNTNIKVPKSQFILLFNEQKRKWLLKQIDLLESGAEVEDIEEILQSDIPLTKLTENTLKADFQLPADFFRRVGSYNLATKGSCTGAIMVNWYIKPKDLNVLLQNDHNKPSFEYQETIAVINSGKVSIYKTDFTVDELYFTYYREPLDLDMAGYKKIDGTPSIDQQTGLSDSNMEYIIDKTATEAARNYEDVEKTNLALGREKQP